MKRHKGFDNKGRPGIWSKQTACSAYANFV